MNRRKFLTGLGAGLIAAPAIVSIANIMPVRNRLIIPTSQLYTVPTDTDYTFSCYLKSSENHVMNLSSAPNTVWESLSAAGNGWWRYSVQFSASAGENKILKLPIDTCWGAQLEHKGPLHIDLALQGPSGDGLLVLPTFERDWPNV